VNFGKLNESIAAYHSSGAVSSTSLKVFASSPLLYFQRFIEKSLKRPEDEPHEFLIGHASHTLLLEPTEYFKRYYVVPEGVGAKSAADKALRAKLAAENPGKYELAHDDHQLNTKLVASVLSHPEASRLLAGGESEVSWRLQGQCFAVQARTDRFNLNGWPDAGWPFICDLKTCASLKDDSPKSFRRTFWGYGYHISAQIYREVVANVLGIKPDEPRPRFYWIAVEKEPPYGVEVFEIDDLAYDLAARQVHDLFTRLRKCHQTGVWPGSPTEVQVLTPPAWLTRKILDGTDSGILA
jgi:exodeoxyribonuclease VIII